MKSRTLRLSLECLALLGSAACLHAGTFTKANNTDNLNLITSWTNGAAPGMFDVARWDTNVTGANSVALGADTFWAGMQIANPGGPVSITAGNTLTLGTNGIDMGTSLQSLTIGSGLTLAPVGEVWKVTNGQSITVAGAFTRSRGATLVVGSSVMAITSQGTVAVSPTLENGVVPWVATRSSGAATIGVASGVAFGTVTGGNIVAYTGATLVNTAGTGVVFGGIPMGDNSTVNYDLNVASSGGAMTNDVYVNTLRNVGGAYLQTNGTANFRANAVMNSGTGALTISNPIQVADTNVDELVLAPFTQGITLNGVISDNNGAPLKVVVGGTNTASATMAVLVANENTFSGGITLNSGRFGIRTNSIPQSGTVISGPLGTGTITLNGGDLFASGANYIIGNNIFVGPGGGQLQGNNSSPDLTINGNVTGSGLLILNGVFNQNGLFLNGDDSAFTGTVLVAGSQPSNNRLGNTNSGSALAKWIVNGGLAAQLIGGGSYHLGELSSTATTGGLCGHAGNPSPAIQEFIVGELNTSSTFTGVIVNNARNDAATGNSDAAANNVVALTKVGTGVLTLTGSCTNTGPLTINGGGVVLGSGGITGVLSPLATIIDNANFTINRSGFVGQGTNFSASPITGTGSFTQAGTGTTFFTTANSYYGITTVSNGALLINGSIPGNVDVKAGARLGGNGTIGGTVTVEPGATLQAGPSATLIGALTLNTAPVLNGSVLVKVSAIGGQSDMISVAGGSGNALNLSGSALVVSNIGVPLIAGDTFTVLTGAATTGNFSSIVGSPGPGLGYSYANGVLSVTSVTATNATNLSASISGQTVSLGWPLDHLGWVIQAQTNNTDGGISTNPSAWYDIPSSALVTLLNFTNPQNHAVYYRMKLSAPPIGTIPTGLSARSTNHAVELTWTASTNARSYNVKVSATSGGPYTVIANVVTTTFTNTGLVNHVNYYYVVSAVNYNGESGNSQEALGTPFPTPPQQPPNLVAQASHGEILLTWGALFNADSYNVKRSTTTGGPYTTVANPTSPSYLDTSVNDGTTYFYVVSGVNSDGEGTNSAEVFATPLPNPPPPPTNAVAFGEYKQVRLTFSPVFGATSYNVKYSSTQGGPYSTFTNTSSTTVYITDLVNDTPYYFVISSLNVIGEGANSSEVTGTPSSVLPLRFDFADTGSGYPAPPMPPEYDPSLVAIQPLPDPYYWASDPLNIGGTASSAYDDWEHHRQEFQDMIKNYEIGYIPTVDMSNVTVTLTGSGTSRTLTVVVTNTVQGTNRTLTLTEPLALPSATGTFPIIIGMNSPNGSVNASLLTQVAKLTFSHDQVTIDDKQNDSDPYYQLYAAPYVPALNSINTGQYSAWIWGCSRLIDALYKLNGDLGGGAKIDINRIAVTGCSYAGKMALFCGAFDERVTLTIAQESGGGGIPSWRYSATEPPGDVEWLPNTDHNWFEESMFAWGDGTNVSFLPEDHHELISLVAPRALFATDNPDYLWLSNPSAYVSCKAAEGVYTGFGVPDRFGYNIVGSHAHCSTTSTIDSEMGAFINKFLLNQTTPNTIIRDVDPNITSTVNYSRWTNWWGTSNPVLPP